MKIRIGLSNEHVLEYELDSAATVELLCHRVYDSEGLDPRAKKLRIIHAGKVINDFSRPLADYGIGHNDFVHCAVSDRPAPDLPPPATPRRSRTPRSDPTRADSVAIDVGGATPAVSDAADDPDAEIANMMDDDWLASALPSARRPDDSTRSVTSVEGTNNDFLWGIVLGFLLGLVMFVTLLDRHLSRRWRIGVMAGVGCNVSFGLLRSTLVFQSGLHGS